MRTTFTTLLGLLILLAILAYNAMYIVNQNQQALVLNFGKPSARITEPGLNFLIPIAQNAVMFDKRLLDLDTRPQEVLVSDQKRLVVDAFARYRIDDPLQFFQAVGSEAGARARLSDFIGASLRGVLGGATFRELVRDKREELMHRIASEVNVKAKEFGVTVVDVRIKRADLPAQNTQAVFARMQTERKREANEWRAKGEEQSRIIRADADRQVTVLTARATQDSESIRGEGEANSNTVMANAFSKDPDFFAFYRSMKAYEGSLLAGDTRVLLSPDSEFFKYFGDPNGKSAAPTK
jgi:membrane protease subunit HflC